MLFRLISSVEIFFSDVEAPVTKGFLQPFKYVFVSILLPYISFELCLVSTELFWTLRTPPLSPYDEKTVNSSPKSESPIF